MSGFLKNISTGLALALLLVATPSWAARQTDSTQDRASTAAQPASRPQPHAATPRAGTGRTSRSLSPQQQAHIRDRAREFRNMSPQQQRRVRRAYRYYQTLPKSQRRALRQQWKQQERNARSLQPDPRLKARRTGPGSQ